MSKAFKLQRIHQCDKCPWKDSTSPFDIPYGYSVNKHAALSNTIAKDTSMLHTKNMACHHSNGTDEMYCVGWLYNQLGRGNNIGLRIKMMSCENIGKIKIFGKQHKNFEDTLPK